MPEWIKGKSNSSDLLTKMVAKDVVDALMETLQGIEPIPGVTTNDGDRSVSRGDNRPYDRGIALSVSHTRSVLGDSC